MAPRNQIIGLIRFSYPATDGFAVSRMPEDALLGLLHAPDPDEAVRQFLDAVG